MFNIFGGSTEFNQWDTNQRVTEPSMVAGDKVVFLNSSGATHPMKAYSHNGTIVADVPNDLLAMAVPMVVYLNANDGTRTSFTVNRCDKPEGYVYVDNTNWKSDKCLASPKVIVFDAFGIDVASAVFAGGGVFPLDIDHNTFWRQFSADGNFLATLSFGENQFYLPPTLFCVDGAGRINSVMFSLMSTMDGVMFNVDIVFGSSTVGGDFIGTQMTVVSSTTPIPSA